MKHAHDSHYVYIEPFRSPFPFLFFLGVVVVVIALAADWLNGLPVQIVGSGSLSPRASLERSLLSGRADAAASERSALLVLLPTLALFAAVYIAARAMFRAALRTLRHFVGRR